VTTSNAPRNDLVPGHPLGEVCAAQHVVHVVDTAFQLEQQEDEAAALVADRAQPEPRPGVEDQGSVEYPLRLARTCSAGSTLHQDQSLALSVHDMSHAQDTNSRPMHPLHHFEHVELA
jgi:hypothetical protein